MGDDTIEDDKIVYNGNRPVLGRDPAEYIGGLERAGVQFSPGRPGRWFEMDPERMTAAQQAEAYRLRSFWLATPDRRHQVVAELQRRWTTA